MAASPDMFPGFPVSRGLPIDAVKSQARIEDVIGRAVPLKRHGSWYQGRCPFHDDQHPSLIVWPRTQTWKCMTCSPMRDDVIGFVVRWQGISLAEAVQWLTTTWGILPAVSPARPHSPADRSPGARCDPLAPLAVRDQTYRRLMARWGLSAAHRQALRQRGLSDRGMARSLFASVAPGPAPVQPAQAGVPGFVRRGAHWYVAGPAGLAIPVRALTGEIQALQIRVDAPATGSGKYRWFSTPHQPGGASSEAPIHVARGVDDIVWITEGPLKAIVAQDRLRHTVLGVPGITAWSGVPAILAALRPARVILAFDQDADPTTAAQVAHHSARLAQVLTDAGCTVYQAHWRGPKGLDDALVAGARITWT